MSPLPPVAVGFDFGSTLVEVAYPDRELREAGPGLLRLLGIGEGASESAAVEVDRRVDELVARAHARDPLHEADIVDAYRQAIVGALGVLVNEPTARKACLMLQAPWTTAVTPLPGAIEGLVELRRSGARLGMLSNAPYPGEAMRAMLERTGIGALLDVAIFSSELGVRKPAPEAFAALLAGLGTAADRTWFVGDEWEADILGARRAGMEALLAPGAALPSGSVCRLESFADLATRYRQGRAGAGDTRSSP